MSKNKRTYVVTPHIFGFLQHYRNGLVCASCQEPILLGDTVTSTISNSSRTKRRHLECSDKDSRPR